MSQNRISKIKKSLIGRIRKVAWRVLGPVPGQSQYYVGEHGCIRCAALFLAWNQIDGDYLEFSVFQGRSFAGAYHAIGNARGRVRAFIGTQEIEAWYRRRPRYLAFDSFCGLPGGEAARQADFGEGAYSCSESAFLENIKEGGVDLNDVVTVAGFYNQTLTPETKRRLDLVRASLVLVDCDLYESTVPVLDFITDIVGQGTIIIFDDWYRYEDRPDKGEQRACREWLDGNPQIQLVQYWQEGPHAVAFLVNIVQVG